MIHIELMVTLTLWSAADRERLAATYRHTPGIGVNPVTGPRRRCIGIAQDIREGDVDPLDMAAENLLVFR